MKRTPKSKVSGNTSTGRWTTGLTVDFLLTASHDKAAVLGFFRKAIRQQGEPEVATIDKSGTCTAALADINKQKSKEEAIVICRSNYLNNPVEQDHRNIKRRARCMMRFKSGSVPDSV